MQIESSIIQALKSLGIPPDITLVLSDRSGVEPFAPYLLINVINSTNIGMPTKTLTHTENIKAEKIFQVRDYFVSFTFHAEAKDPVQDWVQRFYTSLYSDLVDYAFSQQGLGLVGADNIMYQSSPVNNKNYKRSTIDITFRTELEDGFTINQIKEVEYEGTLVDSLGGDTGKVNIYVPIPTTP